MKHEHTEYVEGCFTCKVKTLQFGIVPGGYKDTNSKSYFDKDSLPDLPGREEVMDARTDYANAPVKEMKIEDLAQH